MNIRKMLFVSTAIARLAPSFNNPGWKLDADGHVVLSDGNPVWVDANGQERALRSDAIASANNEAKQNRQRAETAEQKLAKFSIDGKALDPEKVIADVQKLATIDQSKLIDSGKLDEVRNQITTQYTGQISERDKRIADLTSELDNKYIETEVFGSEFMDRVAIPRDMFQAAMGSHFKRENGKIVAYDKSGNVLKSDKHIGEDATPVEALEKLVGQRPDKDHILKAHDANGTGNNGGGGGRGGGRTINRADFAKLPPHQQAETAEKARKGEITLTD